MAVSATLSDEAVSTIVSLTTVMVYDSKVAVILLFLHTHTLSTTFHCTCCCEEISNLKSSRIVPHVLLLSPAAIIQPKHSVHHSVVCGRCLGWQLQWRAICSVRRVPTMSCGSPLGSCCRCHSHVCVCVCATATVCATVCVTVSGSTHSGGTQSGGTHSGGT